ncbi:glutathione S-transferase family protein [Psychrobacter sp. I-STPA6b]|uniref:glutathione S-transferase family protein n=1 Tax=Psychrobacter sp. I-STPA6b TaxID=2585718 RepID=UPI001D0BFBE5|nr:glutathione S-transferase family protein [Psychrobacter sp. I-STPA6b]
MLTLYGNKLSGNSYKTQLVCALLCIEHEWIEVDILAGETRQSDFLKINPLGQVPVLKIDNELTNDTHNNPSETSTILLESNAIIRYLAHDSWLIPTDPIAYAQMWQWLIYEQTEVRFNLASIRFIKKFQNMIASRMDEYQQKFAQSQQVLSHLEAQFSERDFILGKQASLADIALYAYSHKADEGGIEITNYPHLITWFKRIENLPNFIAFKG